MTDMPELHARLLADVIALGSPYPLVLTGGYAVRAHRLVSRPSQDLDVATENPAPMADIAATLRAGLESRGWRVQALETAHCPPASPCPTRSPGRTARSTSSRRFSGGRSSRARTGPYSRKDVIGTKVRALADRGAPRDLIDVFAASRRWSTADLEEFGRRHARGRFEREDLQASLTGAEWTDDEAFAAYGLDGSTISALRAWAVDWADALAALLLEESEEPDAD